jgi:hypothetical protein
MASTTQLVLEPGVNSYALPQREGEPVAVLLMSSESCRVTTKRESGPDLDWSPLSPEPLSEVRRHQRGGPGTPVCWCVEDGKLLVAPTPAVAVTLEVIG